MVIKLMSFQSMGAAEKVSCVRKKHMHPHHVPGQKA